MSIAESLDQTDAPALAFMGTSLITWLKHSQLQPSPLNPRKHARSGSDIADLANSIADRGVLQNLVVRQLAPGQYEIAAGEGRWRAVVNLIDDGRADGDYMMPVNIRELSDEDVIEIGLIENLQRNELHPLDEAQAFFELYSARAKTGGKKAAAEAVDYLAGKVHRSKRYVQKRIRLARDLIPQWRALLDQGVLSLTVANILSAMPEAAQEDELEPCTDHDTGTIVEDEVRRLTVRAFTRDWRALSTALFDKMAYDGEVEEIDGDDFATDSDAFDALQKQAAADLTKKFRAQAKAGTIAFFAEGHYFNAADYEQQKDGDEPDPAGGVFLLRHPFGTISLYRGLFKTVEAVAQEVKTKKVKTERAKREKKTAAKPEAARKPDPRVASVRAHLAANPAEYLAVYIYNDLSDEPLDWAADGSGNWNGKAAGLKRLAKLTGTTPPKGVRLLEHLLQQNLKLLIDVWVATVDDPAEIPFIDKPTAAEQTLFDYCGVTLPDELALTKAAAKSNPKTPNPKTGAKRTASKSKPTTKKGKNK